MINIKNQLKIIKIRVLEEDSIENMITTAEVEDMLSTEALVIEEVEEVVDTTIIMDPKEIIIMKGSIDRIEVGEVEEDEEILEVKEIIEEAEETIEVKEIIEEVEEEADITKTITITNKIKST